MTVARKKKPYARGVVVAPRTSRGGLPRDQVIYLRMTAPEKRRLEELAALYDLNAQNALRLLVKQAHTKLIEEPRGAQRTEEEQAHEEGARVDALRHHKNVSYDLLTTRLLADRREGGGAAIAARGAKGRARRVRGGKAPAKGRRAS